MQNKTISESKTRALDYYRRLVALLYREIGVIKSTNHKEVSEKKKATDHLFGSRRKDRARDFFVLSLPNQTAPGIRQLPQQRTGLSLEDIHRAFSEGNWMRFDGTVSYGGPKWAAIAATTIQLGTAIENESWAEADGLVKQIDSLRHNNGPITGKFKELG